ncbi:hypothetical protein SDC9_197528 [bioreactor metagenome]|uniref:Uncharacterized protein n=1 Tax=bioreactor metagenome TaxID=1076179 RepID=A0A645INI8_9ZZZZ
MLLEVLAQGLKELRVNHHIIVQQTDQITGTMVEPKIVSAGKPEILFAFNQLHP